MKALRQLSILAFFLAVSFQARAQYWSFDEDCPVSGTCVPSENQNPPKLETVDPNGFKMKPEPYGPPAPTPKPAPSNNTPDYLKTEVTQCLDAARAAQSSCDNATSNVKSRKNDLAAAANNLTGSTGQNCKMLANQAQKLRDDMDDWKSSCDQKVTDCNNACPQSLSQQLSRYDDGAYYQNKMANACGASKSKASNIGQMLSDAAGAYVSLNQCLNDITGANAAAQQSPLQPLGNFMPQQTDMQSQICALNPQACGSAGSSSASPYTTPAAQAAGSKDDSAPANTSLDMGSDRPSVGADDPNRQRNYPQPIDPSTLAAGGQPVNPGAGFNQLPPTGKKSGGGYAAPAASAAEVYRGYYSNNADPSFRPGGPSVDPQADLRKGLRPQVGSKLGAPPSAVKQLLAAQMQTELNRKLAGYDRIDGVVGPDGLTGPRSQLWYKVRLRYKNIEPYLTP